MCVIVDSNIAHLIFNESPDRDFLPVLDWIQNKDGCLVLGGRLAAELFSSNRAHRYVLELNRAGKAISFPVEIVNCEEHKVEMMNVCISNDPHVIALARVSGARTLCSHDRALHRDFKNGNLISNPKGSIYQTEKHQHLLRHTKSCKQGK
jgi:hypothetical protein